MTTGVAAIAEFDFDNDGYVDLIVTKYDMPGILLRKRGEGTFITQYYKDCGNLVSMMHREPTRTPA